LWSQVAKLLKNQYKNTHTYFSAHSSLLNNSSISTFHPLSSGKLQQLARFGFYFTQRDGRTCNPEAVHRAQEAMERGRVDVGGPVRLSWGRFQFKVGKMNIFKLF
jgi:hypothetical protein